MNSTAAKSLLGTEHQGYKVIGVLREGGGSRPHVLRVAIDGGDAVLKDFGGCDRWFALSLGPLLARREQASLRALQALSGVPNFVKPIGRRALLMQYIDAEPVVRRYDRGSAGVEPSFNTGDFVAKLAALVEAMHLAGVAHGDLRSPMNTLITPEGDPVLVDFTASLRSSGTPWPGRAFVFDKLREVDRSAVTKLRLRIEPESVDPYTRAAYLKRGLLDTTARRTGKAVRWLSRLLVRR